MADCVFCTVQNDKSKLLYEDDKCYMIFDIFPATEGHLLIISQGHYKNMMEAPEDIMTHMFVVTQKYYKIVWEKLKPTGCTVVTNTGPGHVDHFHIHIIPRYTHSKPVTLPRGTLSDSDRQALKKKLGLK